MVTDTRSTHPRSREIRLRNTAKRQGLRLVKSRRRDPLALDYGGHWLVDVSTNGTILGGDHGGTLDDVEAFLTRPREA